MATVVQDAFEYVDDQVRRLLEGLDRASPYEFVTSYRNQFPRLKERLDWLLYERASTPAATADLSAVLWGIQRTSGDPLPLLIQLRLYCQRFELERRATKV